MRKLRASKKGAMDGVSSTIIGLVIGVGVAVIAGIFINTIGGAAYAQNQAMIASIGNASNDTIRMSIQNSISNGFVAQKTIFDYMPLIILGVVIALILALILGLPGVGNRGGGNTSL